MKEAKCAVCGTTTNLFTIPSPSRHYFSVCRADLNRWNDTTTPTDADETLKVRATFSDDVDTGTAHTALLGQFPHDAAIRVQKASSVRNGHDITFVLLVPTDKRCDAGKALDTFQREWNAEVTTIEGTRFDFPVNCKDTTELRKRQKWCRDHRNTAKYPALRKDA